MDDESSSAPDSTATLPRDAEPTSRMPPWLPRAIVLAVAAFAAYQAGGWLLSRLRGLIVMLLVSLFLSFAIEPAVNWLERRGWRRGAATGLVFLLLFASTALFAFAIGTVITNQIEDFVDRAPEY